MYLYHTVLETAISYVILKIYVVQPQFKENKTKTMPNNKERININKEHKKLTFSDHDIQFLKNPQNIMLL